MTEKSDIERIVATEVTCSNIERNLSEVWCAIDFIRKTLSDAPDKISNVVEKEIAKVCEKLKICQNLHNESMKGARSDMKEELEAMGKNMDRVWGITWKFMVLVLGAMVTFASWNFATNNRIAHSEQIIAAINEKINQSEKVNVQLLSVLNKMENKLNTME